MIVLVRSQLRETTMFKFSVNEDKDQINTMELPKRTRKVSKTHFEAIIKFDDETWEW